MYEIMRNDFFFKKKDGKKIFFPDFNSLFSNKREIFFCFLKWFVIIHFYMIN